MSDDHQALTRVACLAALGVWAVLLLAACGSTDEQPAELVDRGFGFGPTITERIRPAFDPQQDSFFRTPWPSDARRAEDGTLEANHFPHDDQFPISSYLEVFEKIDGFSTLPVVYVPLDRSIQKNWLPGPAKTLETDSPIQLVDVSEQACGDRIPVDVNYDAEGGKFARENTLRIATAYGFPLEPERSYALIVRRDFGNSDGVGTLANKAAQRAISGDLESGASEQLRAWSQSLQPLRRCANSRDDLSIDKIGIATVFTTQDPITPLVKLRDAAVDPEVTGMPSVSNWRRREQLSSPGFREVYSGRFEAPIFQQGQTPFPGDGGLGLLDGDQLDVHSRQSVRFNLMVPEGESPPHPLVVWQPGTGGDAESVIGQRHLNELLRRGFAVATFTPPFHGDRPGSSAPITNTFNYINARAGRSNIRQQAAETSYFLRVLQIAVSEHPERPSLSFERLVYGGQSQGAVVGSLLAGVEPDIDVFAFNGVGGYFATSVLYRNDEFINVQEAIQETLGIERAIDRFSLIVQMAQTIVDVGDPLNFAPRWRGWESAPSGAHVLMINGGQDQTFTRNAMNSLAIAAGVPPVGTPGWPYDPNGLVETSNDSFPVRGNREARDGTPLTLGTHMVAGSGHFTIFRRPAARDLLVNFIDSAIHEQPPPVVGAER